MNRFLSVPCFRCLIPTSIAEVVYYEIRDNGPAGGYFERNGSVAIDSNRMDSDLSPSELSIFTYRGDDIEGTRNLQCAGKRWSVFE